MAEPLLGPHNCQDNTYPYTEESEKETFVYTVCNVCGKILSMVILVKGENQEDALS